jgi:Dolichyl-phosphate-mannose-protein mannosyltransferase
LKLGKAERLLTGPVAAGVVLLAFWTAICAGMSGKSMGFDEILHATAGYSYWRYGDYGMQPENGNLPQRVAGLPLALGPGKPPPTDSADWRDSEAPLVGYDWFYTEGNDAVGMIAEGRAACAIMAVALGALVWAWSRSLFGPRAGLLSLLLYVLNPTILANGALMTSDTAASLFFLAAVWGWWSVLRRATLGRIIGSSALCGGLFVSKMSAPLILPVMVILAAVRIWDRRPLPIGCAGWTSSLGTRRRQAGWIAATALIHAAVTVAIIWLFYGFRSSAFPRGMAGDSFAAPWEYVLGGGGLSARAIGFLRDHQLLPESWLYGMAQVLRRADGRAAFWNGRFSTGGWPGFFPYTFLVKTPLALFGIGGLAAALAWMGWRRSRTSDAAAPALRDEILKLLPLVVLSVVYWVAAITSHLNIGHRHLLPIYPPLFILCGAAARWTEAPWVCALWGRRTAMALAALLVILAAEAAWRYPNEIEYFNGVVRPSQAYRHLVDSSLDWGEELPATARYIADHPAGGPYYLSYFGMSDPEYRHVKASLLYSFGGPYLRGSADLLMVKIPPNEAQAEIARGLRKMTDYEVEGEGQLGDDTYAVLLEKPERLQLHGGTYLISATMYQPVYGPPGPWTARYDAVYRQLRDELRPLVSGDAQARNYAMSRYDPGTLKQLLDRFEEYRFARLRSYLRTRLPDDEINYSVLVFHLTDADLAKALE